MKQFSSYVILLLIALVLVEITSGCAYKKNKYEYSHWPETNPEADAWVDSLEREYIGCARAPFMRRYIDSLQKIADYNKNIPQIGLRANYWRAVLAKAKDNDTLGSIIASKIIKECDSAKYEYDYARFRELFSKQLDLRDRYNLLISNLGIFDRAGDNYRQAETLNRLGYLFSDFNDNATALQLYQEAYRLTEEKYPYEHFMIAVNIALKYEKLGDMEKCFEIADTLKNSKFAREGLSLFQIYRLNYLHTGNSSYLYGLIYADPEIYDINRKNYEKVYVRSELAKYYLNPSHLNPDSAKILLEGISADPNKKPLARKSNIEANMMMADYIGDSTSFAAWNQKLKEYNIEMEYDKAAIGLQHDNSQFRTDTLKDYFIKRQNNSNKTWTTIIAVMVILILASVFILRRKSKQSDIRTNNLQREIEMNRRRLAAASLQISEKENALNSALMGLNELRKEQPSTTPKTAALTAEIKSRLADKQDWESFNIMFAEVEPEFVARLKQRCGSLTTGDIRLACLLKMRLDTKQIARILNIAPDSAKKSRYRLRSKLGMTSDQTFEQFFDSI